MYIIGGIILIVLGVFMIVNPGLFYRLTERWKTSGDTDPSKLYIINTRFGGIMCLLVGVASIGILLFHA